MKWNKTVKITLTAALITFLVDMWRNFPWVKAIVAKSLGKSVTE